MSFFGRLFGKKQKEEKVEVVKEPVVEEAVVEETVVEETVVEEAVVVEEPVVEEVKEVPVKEEVKEVTKPTESKKVVSDEDLYEIRTHKDEGWQVIKKGASRARRRFDTQAECVNYCKDMNYEFEVYNKNGEKR